MSLCCCTFPGTLPERSASARWRPSKFKELFFSFLYNLVYLAWQRLDLIAVPAYCSLPAPHVERVKQQWKGQLRTKLKTGTDSPSDTPELDSWKVLCSSLSRLMVQSLLFMLDL